jgi:hypothetical protein
MLPIPRNVTTFGELVDWLIREKHEGKPYRMARALQVSSGLPFQWVHRTIAAPSMDKVARLCEVYDLDPRDVWQLIFPMPIVAKPTPPTGGKPGTRAPLPVGAGGTKKRPGRSIMTLSAALHPQRAAVCAA